MDLSPVRRRTVALVAAYAVALQTLLAAFVPVALPPGRLLRVHVLPRCRRPRQPAQHDPPCAAICAAMGQGIAGPLPTGMVVSVAAQSPIAALIPAGDWVPPSIAATDSHAPRGPPLA
jgi:hypothetical protein